MRLKDTEDEHPPIMHSLRRSEPLIVLASLTLIITVFTYENKTEFLAIYNYSVIATFMFIISFLFAIVADLIYVRGQNKQMLLVRRWLGSLGMYFFLSIGLVYLLLIAADFAFKGSQILQFVAGYIFLFFIGANVLIYKFHNSDRPPIVNRERKWFDYGFKTIVILAVASSAIFAADMLIRGFFSGFDPLPLESKFYLIILTALPMFAFILFRPFVVPAPHKKAAR